MENKCEENNWEPVASCQKNKTILIMRHGQSVGNQKKIIQGLTDDYGLSIVGAEQITNIINNRRQELEKIDRIVTSPSLRAVETATIIQSQLGSPLLVDASLVEMNPGILAGNTHEYNCQMYPEYYKIWMHRKDLNGIPGAEKGKELQARAVSFLMNYMKEDQYSDLVVSHAGFIRCLVNTINGVDRTTPVCVDNDYIHTINNPLENMKFEQRTRAMASEVYIVTTADDKYVVKLKDRAICNVDNNEKALLAELSKIVDGIPKILSLNNTNRGCTKVLEYVQGEHIYGNLTKEQKAALTEKVAQISKAMSIADTSNYVPKNLFEEVVWQEKNAQNPYVKSFAKNILDDSKNIEKLKNSSFCLVHSDLNRDNILFQQSEQGWKVSIVDWEGVDLLPKDYQLASYLASSLLIENEKVAECMKVATAVNKEADKDFTLFLMKIRLLKGLYYFAENKNTYTESNEPVADEILKKYFNATKKIKQYEVKNSKMADAPQNSTFILNIKGKIGR